MCCQGKFINYFSMFNIKQWNIFVILFLVCLFCIYIFQLLLWRFSFFLQGKYLKLNEKASSPADCCICVPSKVATCKDLRFCSFFCPVLVNLHIVKINMQNAILIQSLNNSTYIENMGWKLCNETCFLHSISCKVIGVYGQGFEVTRTYHTQLSFRICRIN